MYVNYRHHKEPEINKLVTGSMAPWNTGQLGQEALMKEQEKLMHPIHVEAVNKEQNLKDIVKKYQESQFYNYQIFLGELGQLGYCTMPIEIPTILEIVPSAHGRDMRANMTYRDYKNQNKRGNEIFGCENGSSNNKRFKVDDGWGDDAGTKTVPSNSGWSDEEGGKTDKNDIQQRPTQVQATWDDEGNNGKRPRNKFDHRTSTNTANRMQSGWSDEEMDQSRNNDRFGEKSSFNDRFNGNNDRFGGNNDRRGGGRNNDRGFRGRGRGRGRGQWNGNRNDNNDRFNNKNNNYNNNNNNNADNAAASGWSDDESKEQKDAPKTAIQNTITAKIDPIDDWDNPEPIIKQDSLTDKSLSTNPSTMSNAADDGWD